MQLTASRSDTARGALPAAVLMGASLLSLVGATWDIQWHEDVGPDTFFTVPHLLLYAGAAIAGLVSLAVVLSTTAAQRAGRPIDPAVGGRPVRIFGGIFTAPVGYVVSGTGATLFLLYGLWDLWWHSLYGFDAVIDSPPHIGLLLSDMITSIGLVIVLAAGRANRWLAWGTLAAVAMLFTSSTITVLGLGQLPGPVRWTNAGTAFLAVLLLSLAWGFLGRKGVLGAAGIVLALQLAFWWFAPWAARAYADAVGLSVRDYLDGVPVTPALVPFCLVLVAALMAALSRVPVLAGGIAGVVIVVCAPLQVMWLYDAPGPDPTRLIATCVAGALLGLLGGYLGARFGAMLRLTSGVRDA
ncbi:hypothetical protein [Actinokineospora fastidiosa]|uniref:Uncharacterized protein n=1 Tax=Actinokineospora fastidiosa TaxID=1816 RepID=A0A918GE34_9PSEU|nr:hypothetical protein [Actinokineospora fastidiosa]GGS30762.1 hypothetical protein GCM10010171_25480 [Actinokineospora fastidiosa]